MPKPAKSLDELLEYTIPLIVVVVAVVLIEIPATVDP
jgi:hypothetical protein